MSRAGAIIERVSIAVLAVLALIWGQTWLAATQERQLDEARQALPVTADFFAVSYAQLKRKDAALVVYSDGEITQSFEGRYRVRLRDTKDLRHLWTPAWSDWQPYSYTGRPGYRQPESLAWWADVMPDPAWTDLALVMETCWQARIEDELLGLAELEPVCVTNTLDAADDRTR